ncbi:MAG: chemotaxis protein CheB [Bdellovibrionota bacterium]|nr:MAG: hypothetical protein EOP10_03960 [Pseudomonadota bacterium]
MTSQAHIRPDERGIISDLGLKLTGSRPDTDARLESCIVNILRRMGLLGLTTLSSYLTRVSMNESERAHLVSALTIHHTTWFRESIHFDRLRTHATHFAAGQKSRSAPFTVLSAGSSTGEEAYSIGLVLEDVRKNFPHFDYRIEGWDVDPISVQTAARAIYPDVSLSSIPKPFHRFMLKGSAQTQGLVTLDASIRERCHFKSRSLTDAFDPIQNPYQIIFCRNVLIYFKPEQVKSIIKHLMTNLDSQGLLILGHSEAIEAKEFGLEGLANSCYSLPASAQTSTAKVRLVGGKLPNLKYSHPDIILIGSSTGGTDALERMLKDMPSNTPPIVVVQHIAQPFAKSFAERLATVARLSLGSAEDRGILKPNHLYMAFDDYHIGIRRQGHSFVIATSQEPPMHSVRPAVDHLFLSAARYIDCERMLVCILTGMGKDGAQGMRALREKGAMTMTQDQKSSVVYGMPAEAVALGASQFSGTPEELRNMILRVLNLPRSDSNRAS